MLARSSREKMDVRAVARPRVRPVKARSSTNHNALGQFIVGVRRFSDP